MNILVCPRAQESGLTDVGELRLLRHTVVGRQVHRLDEVQGAHVDLVHAAVVAVRDVGVAEPLVRQLPTDREQMSEGSEGGQGR